MTALGLMVAGLLALAALVVAFIIAALSSRPRSTRALSSNEYSSGLTEDDLDRFLRYKEEQYQEQRMSRVSDAHRLH